MKNSIPKILLIARSFPPVVGGIENFMFNVYSRLPVNPVVVAPYGKECKAFDEKHDLQIIRTASVLSFLKNRKSPLIPLFIMALKTVLFSKVDQIHCDQVQTGIIGFLFKIFFGKPYVVWAHGMEITGGGIKSFKSIVLKNAGRIIANSTFTQKALIDRMKVNKSNIVIIHPGVDTKKFNPKVNCNNIKIKYNLAGKKVLLTVGRLSDKAMRKGQDMVIRVLPEVISKIGDVVYLIVGDGDGMERLKNLTHELGIEENVIFTGYVPDEELPRYYNSCDLFIMPSKEILENDGTGKKVEGFGIVFLEANACGKPVIGGRSGGIEDAVIDEVTGLLVNPEDLNDIAEKIIKLLTDDSLAQKLGKQGRERVVNELTWEKAAEKVLQVVKRVEVEKM